MSTSYCVSRSPILSIISLNAPVLFELLIMAEKDEPNILSYTTPGFACAVPPTAVLL